MTLIQKNRSEPEHGFHGFAKYVFHKPPIIMPPRYILGEVQAAE